MNGFNKLIYKLEEIGKLCVLCEKEEYNFKPFHHKEYLHKNGVTLETIEHLHNTCKNNLHQISINVGCKEKNNNQMHLIINYIPEHDVGDHTVSNTCPQYIWCPHPECLESLEYFSTEDKLNEHIKLKHNNTVFIKDIGNILIPERNTINEILDIIDNIGIEKSKELFEGNII